MEGLIQANLSDRFVEIWQKKFQRFDSLEDGDQKGWNGYSSAQLVQ